jgi:peptidyl-prolyl cis-trans isomerase C
MHFTAVLLSLCVLATAAFVPPHPSFVGTTTTTTRRTTNNSSRLYFDIGSMIKNFGKKVSASHILIGPPSSKTGRGMEQEDAIAKLNEIKAEVGNAESKFAEMAEQFSSCRASSKVGGDLGEFGPGMMVGPFDKVCFEEEVGVVHGPVSTPFGEHLILIRERTGDK